MGHGCTALLRDRRRRVVPGPSGRRRQHARELEAVLVQKLTHLPPTIRRQMRRVRMRGARTDLDAVVAYLREPLDRLIESVGRHPYEKSRIRPGVIGKLHVCLSTFS